MRFLDYIAALAVGLLLASTTGCSQGNAAAETIPPRRDRAWVPPVVTDQIPQGEDHTNSDGESSQGDRVFTPPFPERVDLFLPPHEKPKVGDVPYAVVPDVSLRGFADVGGPRVLLSINGRVVTLAQGESHGDLSVLTLKPPSVTLRRGVMQWTESLYKRRADDDQDSPDKTSILIQ